MVKPLSDDEYLDFIAHIVLLSLYHCKSPKHLSVKELKHIVERTIERQIDEETWQAVLKLLMEKGLIANTGKGAISR